MLAACSGSTDNPGSAQCGSCSSGLTCVSNADFPGGACTKACDSSTCASGSKCVQLSTGQFCLPSCASGGSCPSGLVCGPGGTAGNVCSPPASVPATAVSCAAPTLISGGTVGPGTPPSGCQKPIVPSSYAPTLPAIGVATHLGLRNVGETLTVQFPAGTSGFSVISQGAATNAAQVQLVSGAAANAPLPTPIGSPSNANFFTYPELTDRAPTDCTILWSGPLSPVTAAVTFPNTTAGLAQADAGLPIGTWSFTVSDLLRQCGSFSDCQDPNRGSTANQYDITVLTRSGGIPTRGALDVAIYLVTTGGSPTAAGAPNDADLDRVVQQFAADFAKGGVCLQTVTFYDLPAWAQSRYHITTVGSAEVVDPCSDYRQLFTLAQPANAVNLFFVDQVEDSDSAPGTVTIGFDGAIPAPTTASGTVAGGAVVSMSDLRSGGCGAAFSLGCGPDVIAKTAAHESGHSLGLFHPTEADGASGDSFDGLVDTPQCVCSMCASSSAISKCLDQTGTASDFTQVDGAICGTGTQVCGGADYLMFWQLSSHSQGNVSPQEGQVMRMNPVVRPL